MKPSEALNRLERASYVQEGLVGVVAMAVPDTKGFVLGIEGERYPREGVRLFRVYANAEELVPLLLGKRVLVADNGDTVVLCDATGKATGPAYELTYGEETCAAVDRGWNGDDADTYDLYFGGNCDEFDAARGCHLNANHWPVIVENLPNGWFRAQVDAPSR